MYPQFKVNVTESPPVSPSVVAAIFITQNVNVTSGTLLHTRSHTSFMLCPFAAFETVAQFVEDCGENSPFTDHTGGQFDARMLTDVDPALPSIEPIASPD